MALERNKYRPVEGPRTHQNCIDQTGVARPGKTAQDKARGHIPYQKNRRFPDDKK